MVDIIRMSFFGNSNIGIYAYANDKVLLIPPGLKEADVREMASALGVEPIEAKVAGTTLNGVFIAGNNRAIILPHIIFQDELMRLRSAISERGVDVEIIVSESKLTALGNVLLCNDRGCIGSPLIEEPTLRRIEDSLGVEVVKARLVNMEVPGGVSVISNRGGVIHPDASEDDIRVLKDVTKVSVEPATVNAGIPFVKSGIIANNKGVIVGGITTGPEIFRIKAGFEGDGV
ncbi:MAG: translation initiation factor IF-6 [Desulfurococcaceae archaeon]